MIDICCSNTRAVLRLQGIRKFVKDTKNLVFYCIAVVANLRLRWLTQRFISLLSRFVWELCCSNEECSENLVGKRCLDAINILNAAEN